MTGILTSPDLQRIEKNEPTNPLNRDMESNLLWDVTEVNKTHDP